jgi:hypothetical protein
MKDKKLKLRDLHDSHTLGSVGVRGLEHLKIETRLIDERFVSVMGECDLEVIDTPSIFKLIRKDVSLSRMLPTLVLNL